MIIFYTAFFKMMEGSYLVIKDLVRRNSRGSGNVRRVGCSHGAQCGARYVVRMVLGMAFGKLLGACVARHTVRRTDLFFFAFKFRHRILLRGDSTLKYYSTGPIPKELTGHKLSSSSRL